MNDRLWQIFSSTNEWLRYSDGKAVALLGIQGVLIGLAIAFISSSSSSEKPVASTIFLIIGFVSLVISMFASFMTLSPRLKGSGKISPIYFGSISVNFKNSDSYTKFLKENFNTDDKVTDALSEQIHTNSKIASIKFKWVSWSMRFLVIGFVFWVVSVVIELWRS